MKPAIQISGLSKYYYVNNSRKFALKDINLQVKDGRILALLGPNGAGKSTLINILSGLTIKTSGKVYIRNWDIDHLTDRRDSKYHIGIVPQEINFDIFFNPLETLRIQSGFFGIRHNDEYIWYLLEKLDLKKQAYVHTRTLSGGMKRRLLIAKALVHQPQIIVLDEPTAGVDINLRWQLWDMIRMFCREGKTIILTTHYLEEAEVLADDIAIVHKGKLITVNTKQNLLQDEHEGDCILAVKLIDPLSRIPMELESWQARLIDKHTIHISYQRTKQELRDILRVISSIDNLNILTIDSHNLSLEEVFCNLIKKHS